jgi:N-dimethylarginine dimethylaminohydrolase
MRGILTQFLVCPPTPSAFAGSDARRQSDRFIETLQCAGDVNLVEVPSRDDAPRLVFTARGALIVGKLVGCRVLPLMLVDERFPHLDMALCPLASGHVLVYMNAFSPHAQTMLRRTIDPTYLIEIDIDDALDLSCSAVEIGDVLVLHRVSRGLRERLNRIGYRIFCTELDEFIRAGGSAKSMALRFDQGSAPAMQAVLAR